MAGRGKVKRFFPGGNTSLGFYSYYDYVIKPSATRMIIIKGGPGVGKSTIMRWIGEEMLNRGYDVEFHHCSSDSDSIDGIVIPAIQVAMVDGTAPHVTEPKNPGAVDEILYLGDYWNEDLLRKNKDKIMAAKARVSRLFKIAYCQLAEAKVIKDELDSYYDEASNWAMVNGTIHEIAKSIFSKADLQFKKIPEERHLFATAFTPKGKVHHLDSILQDVETLHLITGEAGAIASHMVGTLAHAVNIHGLDSEVYHCALEPEKVDLVVVPSIKLAILKEIPGISFKPQDLPEMKQVKTHDLNQFIDQDLLTVYDKEIRCCNERLHAAICRALSYIAAAKAEHDLMEKHYIPTMDFGAINAKRDEILRRILKYAEEFI
ncbi:PRK06851 family protein [Desulfofalx alkaliphila]|uniref:PRK06851 family protein n=1 Tax=Desulfofalx alkaliphila TaxID=105483 RepID=UPI0004E11CE9|nr:PRK06851 family protein [Desulfofalx alkaliphila]